MFQFLYLMFFSFLFLGDLPQSTPTDSGKDKILFVVSNADHYGVSNIPASNHFAEIVYPYDVLKEAGYIIDFVSPEGGAVPLGYFDTSEPIIRKYIYDCEFMSLLANTYKPEDIDPLEYKVIYFGGGGAAMFGVADNHVIQGIATTIYEENQGIVSSVCHGSIGLANLQLNDGRFLVAGKKINGFPDIFENQDARYFKEFEYTVEGLLKLRGADFIYSEEGWDGFYQIDDRIITGQDPSSAKKVAETIINKLK